MHEQRPYRQVILAQFFTNKRQKTALDVNTQRLVCGIEPARFRVVMTNEKTRSFYGPYKDRPKHRATTSTIYAYKFAKAVWRNSC